MIFLKNMIVITEWFTFLCFFSGGFVTVMIGCKISHLARYSFGDLLQDHCRIEGCSTMKRLQKHRDYYLRFLSGLSIPYQNNPAE